MKKFRLVSLFCLLSLISRSQSSIHSSYPVASHEWFTRNTQDSIRLFILEFGRGHDTVLVLHGGFGAEHSYLLDAFEGLYDKYHFIFYDQRGSLRSPCPDSLITLDKMVEDIESIRKEMKLSKLNLFGHSNGSSLASFYLQKYPQNVKGFIMCAFVKPKYPLRNDKELRRLENIGDSSFQVFNKRPEIQLAMNKIDMSAPLGKIETDRLRILIAGSECYDVENWKKMRSSFWSFYSSNAARAVIQSVEKEASKRTDGMFYNFEPTLKNHPYPITIIMGEYDMIDFGGKLYEKWLMNFPNMERILIKNAAHSPWWDKPIEFRKAFVKGMDKYKQQ